MIQIVFGDRGLSDCLQPNLTWTVERYANDEWGGPDTAALTARGGPDELLRLLNYLRAPVYIYDSDLADWVWWGFVEDVQVDLGRARFAASLRHMANKVAVVYAKLEPGESGAGSRVTSDWAQDTFSQAEYGTKEYIASIPQASQETAEARRDNLLTILKNPLLPVRVGGAGEAQARLVCKGWIHTLDWVHYSQAAGLEQYTDAASAEAKVGLEVRDLTISFDNATSRIADSRQRFILFASNERIRILGSASNNGLKTVTAVNKISNTRTDFVFTASTKRITATGLDFTVYAQNAVLAVSGSSYNDGYYTISAVDTAYVAVSQTLVDESSGASITLQTGASLTISEVVTTESAGADVRVIVRGERAAQSFQISSGSAWDASALEVRAKITGIVANNLKLAIHADSSGNPGAELASATIGYGVVGTSFDWEVATLASTLTLQPATTYHLVVTRSSTDITGQGYYAVAVNEDLGYSSGSFKLYDGSAWTTRPVDADMLFRVRGVQETTAQIEAMVTAAGEFFEDVWIEYDSGVYSSQYRDGDNTALFYFRELMADGATGKRLLAQVTPGRVLRIYAEPTETAYIYDAMRGKLRTRTNMPVPSSACPTGVWVEIDGLPPQAEVAQLASLGRLFAARAEYYPGRDLWLPESRGVDI